jgi:hypothetical protein
MALLRLALLGSPACLAMPGPLHAGEFDPAVAIYTLPFPVQSR